MKIKQSNIILYCKNWEECIIFYKEKLKLEINFSKSWFVEFSLNDFSKLSIANEEKATIKSAEGLGVTISLNIENINEYYLKLKEIELNPTKIKEIWGSKSFYIYDPEGNRIEFWEENV